MTRDLYPISVNCGLSNTYAHPKAAGALLSPHALAVKTNSSLSCFSCFFFFFTRGINQALTFRDKEKQSLYRYHSAKMSNQVAPQIDVGNLTVQGLGAFLPLLATLTADDVQPMAMIQMEQLGALFPINGEYAAKVPDYLQRCNSTRLDRLGVLVGWRKGDTASLMAKSAGGQAISLLSVCLMGLFPNSTRDGDRVGDILLTLSQRSLSRTFSLSSGDQLRQVVDQLASKLAIMGFGNLLAREAVWINDAYGQLNTPYPTKLLDGITAESAVELLHAISRALTEETLLVRISGSQGMAYILCLVKTMFPHDLLVTVENIVVYEGGRNNIILEISTSKDRDPTTIRLENVLKMNPSLALPIELDYRRIGLGGAGYFQWQGWVAHRLQLFFAEQGLNCPEEIRIACAQLLLRLPAEMKGSRLRMQPGGHNLLSSGLISLLGNYPNSRMIEICQQQFNILFFQLQDGTVSSAVENLEDVFKSKVHHAGGEPCHQDDRCYLKYGWTPDPMVGRSRICKRQLLWSAVRYALDTGLAAFFIDAGADATIRDNGSVGNLATSFLEMRRRPEKKCIISSQSLHNHIMQSIFGVLFSEEIAHRTLMQSDSSTAYPRLLLTMALDANKHVSYDLLDGRIQYNGRYHATLDNQVAGERWESRESLDATQNTVQASSAGVHSSIMFTLFERSNGLDLCCAVRFAGRETPVNVCDAIVSSFGLCDSRPCGHSRNTALSSRRVMDIITTSVECPQAFGKKIAIVQTAGNPTAQLLACEGSVDAIIQKLSCLNCAYDEAVERRIKKIIVG